MPANSEIINTPFFFIIGRPRSGTTLLRHLFDAHPNVIIPSECNYILALSGKYKRQKKFTRKTLEHFLDDLKRTKSFDTLSMDDELLKKNVFSVPENITYPELCKIVHATYASIHEKKEILLIGDKNPAYSSENFSKVFSLFPEAKYIHLIRDYRDQITSLLTAGFKLPSPAFIAIAWKKSINTINNFKKKFPDHFYTIRYEDFVREPEMHLKKICCFLGIKFQEDIFNFIDKKNEYLNHHPSYKYGQLHQRLFQPINSNRIGIYHDFLNSRDLAVVEKIVGNVSKQYGYKENISNTNILTILTVIKWHFIYKLFVLLRSFSFTLPIQKRNYFIGKIKMSRTLSFFYFKMIKSKTTKK